MTTQEFKERYQNWKTAATPTYLHITEQLAMCQANSMSGMFCDDADIGKSFTALSYSISHSNVVYIDCSQVKSKQRMVRKIAEEIGSSTVGKYAEVYAELIITLKALEKPLIIMDEAGDLQYDAFLELKALWNATERQCGWYMMGADGLQEKVSRSIGHKKVGYTEIFSRYGKRYQRVSPLGDKENSNFQMLQASLVIRANAPKGTDIQTVMRNTEGSLRRINHELAK